MRCELVSLLSQDLESGLFCCQVPKRLLAMCLEFTSLELWDFFGVSFVFCQALVQGTGGFTDGSREGCSQCAWDAVAFWVLPQAQGRTQCPQTRAKHCNLCFLGHSALFGLPLPTVMVAAMCTLIFVLFLSSVLLCATGSAVTCPAHCEL